ESASGNTSDTASGFGSQPAERISNGNSSPSAGNYDECEHNQSLDSGAGAVYGEYYKRDLYRQIVFAGRDRTRARKQPWPSGSHRHIASSTGPEQSQSQLFASKHCDLCDGSSTANQSSGSRCEGHRPH